MGIFAMKAIRGFFHDSMTSWVEGSILHETDVDFNAGLCKWSEYVNVLSDETGCDPGSIITMGGFLGYQACGVQMYDHHLNNQDALRTIKINQPHECRSNLNPLFMNMSSKKKLPQFHDRMLMKDTDAAEKFWLLMMQDTVMDAPLDHPELGFLGRYYYIDSLEA